MTRFQLALRLGLLGTFLSVPSIAMAQLVIPMEMSSGGSNQVLITEVIPGAQAATLGIMPGDIIVSYGEFRVTDMQKFVAQVKNSNPSDRIQLRLRRGGQPFEVMARGGGLGVRLMEVGQMRMPNPTAIPVDPRMRQQMQQAFGGNRFNPFEMKAAGMGGRPSTDPILRVNTHSHMGRINAIDVDAAGRFMVTVSSDKTIKVWSLDDRTLERTLRPPIGQANEGRIDAVAISPDGSKIAVAGWTGLEWEGRLSVYLFDRESGRMIDRIPNLPSSINDLEFFPDGRRLAIGLSSGMGVWVVDLATHKPLLQEQYGQQVLVDVAPDGRMVTASSGGEVRLYDSSGFLRHTVQPTDGALPKSVEFSPDGSQILVAFNNNPRVFILAGDTLKTLFKPSMITLFNSGGTSDATWSRDGVYVYWTGVRARTKNKIIRRWRKGGRGGSEDFKVRGEVTSLAALSSGEVAFATTYSVLGLVGPNWEDSELWEAEQPVFRESGLRPEKAGRNFRVSADGGVVQFGLEPGTGSLVRFSIGQRSLTRSKKGTDLTAPDWNTRKFSIHIGQPGDLSAGVGEFVVSGQGSETRDAFESGEKGTSMSVADNSRWGVLGSNQFLRGFDQSGRQIWKVPEPNEVHAVNIVPDGEVVLAALGNGVVRWYRMRDGQELLSLFVHADGKRWVLWTPDGYFDASPGGAELVGYHVNRGPDQAAQFVDIDKIYDQFYRPDLVAQAWSLKGRGGPFMAYNGAARTPTVTAKQILDAGLAPTVRFMSPPPGKQSIREIEATIRLEDQGGGIGRIVWQLNGITIGVEETGRGIAAKRSEKPAASTQVTKLLSLSPGENVIRATAYNEDGHIASDPATLTLHLEDAISRKPALHILIVGVNKYRDKTLRLNYSVADGRDLAARFRSVGSSIFTDVHVTELYDGDVTQDGLANAFRRITHRVEANDVFVFYLAGHGITLDGRYHFLPADFRYRNSDAIRTDAIGQDQIQELLSLIPAQKSLVLLDTCNSGSFVEAQVVSRGLAEKTAIDKLIRATGRAVIAASADSQVALEGYEGHGVFTWVLIKALEEADGKNGNRDGVTSTAEIASYINERVPDLTYKKWGYEQVPQVNLHGREFPVGVVE